MEKDKKTNKKKNITLAVMSAVFAVSLMCSCGGGATKSVDSEHAKSSAGQTSADNIEEPEKEPKRTVQLYLSDEDEHKVTVLDFGEDSAFGGIEVETDEEGELVCVDKGGSIWCKITDSRFGTYSKLSRFARKHMGSGEADKFLQEADVYFVTSNGNLYFVDGSGGRTISSNKRYVMNGGSTVQISSTHTAECRKKYGITRSSVDFVKSDGKWKLSSIQNS